MSQNPQAEIVHLRATIETLKENHARELVAQARGRKVDVLTALTMERLRKRCDVLESALTRAGVAIPPDERTPTDGRKLLAMTKEMNT